MRLGEVFELELLQSAGLQVVAGGDNLSRPIAWVHSGEIADIAKFLTGGEVLLTAGTGLAAAGADRRRYVRELSEAGAAGVIIELGRTFDRLPREMTDEAERYGLAIATLDREVPFAAVTRLIHTMILSDHHAAQERATQIGDGFSRLVLEGARVPEMLAFLADRLGNPVVLEDGMRRVVAYGQGASPIGPLMRDWKRHSRDGHVGSAVGVRTVEGEPRCVWTSVALRGEIWGRLHVLEFDSPIDSVAGLVLGRAASNVALYLAAERESYLVESAERSLVSDVAFGTNFSGAEFVARATGLGVNFNDELVMVLMSPDPAHGSAVGPEEPTLEAAEQSVRDWFRQAKWPSLVGLLRRRIVVVAASAAPEELRERLVDLPRQLNTGTGFRIGVSRPAPASALPRAYAEAETAHDLGPAISTEEVRHYDDLVLHRLLAPLAKTGPQLAHFVESEIGELIAYDAAHNSELLMTLDAFLENNGNKAQTADALFLQRRSVYYRLTRIEELLGRSLEPSDHRVRLYLALRAREVIETGGSDFAM